MDNNELIQSTSKELNCNNIKILDMSMVDNYLFIVMSNNQCILTNGTDIYDLSGYTRVDSIFNMGDRLCGSFWNGITLYLVDIKTKEVLFEDKKASLITKQDNRTIQVLMKINGGNTNIYDIENKKYLPAPSNYEFEHSLGNGLYVFNEVNEESNGEFYNKKRCVINADGEFIIKDITGWISLYDNRLIITKKDGLHIVTLNEDKTYSIETLKQNDSIIAKPYYLTGKVIIIEKGVVKFFTPELKLIKEFNVEGLEEVLDYEIVGNTLKLLIPFYQGEERVNKHIYLNMDSGKIISHIRIEGYPYWVPTTFVGQDSLKGDSILYHFYDMDYNNTFNIDAKWCQNVDANKQCLFHICTVEDGIEKKKLINCEKGIISDVAYDEIEFNVHENYGFGVDPERDMMDFFDEDFNILFKDFDYKKFRIFNNFGYFIKNGYLRIINSIVDAYGRSRIRTILLDPNGNVLIDSLTCKCFLVGHLIEIIDGNDITFLNTLNGEVGELCISAPVDENGLIKIGEVTNPTNLLQINSTPGIEESKHPLLLKNDVEKNKSSF